MIPALATLSSIPFADDHGQSAPQGMRMGLIIAQIMCLHCILPSAQSPLKAMLRGLADQCLFCDQDCSEG